MAGSEEQENAGTRDGTVSTQASADVAMVNEMAPSEQSTPYPRRRDRAECAARREAKGIDLQEPRLRMKDRKHAGVKGSKTKWKRGDRECAVRTLKMIRKKVRAGTPRGVTSP